MRLARQAGAAAAMIAVSRITTGTLTNVSGSSGSIPKSELFDDVLDFVRNELDGIVEPRDVGSSTEDEHAFLASHGRTRVIGRGATRQVLEQEIDAQVRSRREPPALAPECWGRQPTILSRSA